jgi:hypothetical protein
MASFNWILVVFIVNLYTPRKGPQKPDFSSDNIVIIDCERIRLTHVPGRSFHGISTSKNHLEYEVCISE